MEEEVKLFSRYRIPIIVEKKQWEAEKVNSRRKKTHEDYIEELKIKNPNVEVVGNYVNAKTKITHKCLIHNTIWETTPRNVLLGKGCKLCCSDKLAKHKLITNEEYVNKLKVKNLNVIPLENYIDAKTKIKHKCLIHNIVWDVSPNHILNGNGCIQCGREKYSKSRTKTHEEYIEELKIKNSNLEPLEKYAGAKTKILHLYKSCGHKSKISPTNALKGIGCKRCSSDDKKITMETYRQKIKDKNINVEPLEELIDYYTPISHRYNQCGHTVNKSPRNILASYGCMKCRSEKLHNMFKMTQEDYSNKLSKVNKDIEVIGEYINNHTKILHRFKKCGHIIEVPPAGVLSGTDCPICNKSTLEKIIQNYLDKNNIFYISQFKKDYILGVNNGLLSYDFCLPQYNLRIEAQGIQHERPIEYFGGIKAFVKQKIHDTRKRKYCHDNNVKLLEIWYYEINKVDKILEQYLNNLKLETVETTGVA